MGKQESKQYVPTHMDVTPTFFPVLPNSLKSVATCLAPVDPYEVFEVSIPSLEAKARAIRQGWAPKCYLPADVQMR